VPIERKNGWTIAEARRRAGTESVATVLESVPWDADALLDLNREYAMEHLADPGGILVADPTGFAKKGTKSVGVQRQYSGTLGRIDNCQMRLFWPNVTPTRDRVLTGPSAVPAEKILDGCRLGAPRRVSHRR